MSIAKSFFDARSASIRLPDFPGALPASVSESYLVQEEALRLSRKEIAGWKVAMVLPALRANLGTERLVGPILAGTVQSIVPGTRNVARAIPGGFAALEAEFAFRIEKSLPRAPEECTADVVESSVGSMHAASEIASSPLATVNTIGPLALIADFGGNGGAIIGPEIPDWRDRELESMRTRTIINGKTVGQGSAASVPGGPLAAVQFLARQLASRNRYLRAGDIVLTGMTTGVHDVKPGDRVCIEFAGIAQIDVDVEAASSSGENV